LPEYRVRSHFYEARCEPGSKYDSSVELNAAIRRHTRSDWSWQLLGEVPSEDQADEAEIAAIAYHNTYLNGYNMTTGGKGRAAPHTEATRHAIFQAARLYPDDTLPVGLIKRDEGYRVMAYSVDGRTTRRDFYSLEEAQAFHASVQDGLSIKLSDGSLPLYIKTYKRRG